MADADDRDPSIEAALRLAAPDQTIDTRDIVAHTPQPTWWGNELDRARRAYHGGIDMLRNSEAGLAQGNEEAGQRFADFAHHYLGAPAAPSPEALNAVTMLMGGVKAPGRPSSSLRLYHGSTEPDLFERFEPWYGNELGPHFGTAEQANERLTQQSMFGGDAAGDVSGMAVFPVDANFRNPLELKDIGWDDLGLIENLRGTKKFTSRELRSLENVINSDPEVFHEALTDLLTSKGYDSIKYRNQFEHPSQTAALRANGRTEQSPNLQKTGDYSYIPIQPGTVKSATSGKTLFSLGSPALGGVIYRALMDNNEDHQ